MQDYISLFHKVGELKHIKRTGWVNHNVPNPESVADHTFRTAVMALLLSGRSKLDSDKCVRLALIHDLGESVIGDLTPNQCTSAEKLKLERKAIRLLFSKVGKEVVGLWEEYEERKTPEAIFVNELDKIEMLLQAFEYEQNCKKLNLGEFWKYAEGRVKDPALIKILGMLRAQRGKLGGNYQRH